MKRGLIWGLSALLILSIAGCGATTKPATGGSSASGNPALESGIYMGTGSDISLLIAMKKAKIDAVKKYVLDLLGPRKESDYRDALTKAIYSTENPNQYVYSETMETTRKDKIGEFFTYEARIKVHAGNVKSTLKANNIYFDEKDALAADEARLNKPKDTTTPTDTNTTTTTVTQPTKPQPTAEDTWGKTTEEEARIINRLLDTMTYMVYAPKGMDNPEAVSGAISIANRYLADQTINAVEASTVEKIIKESKIRYEESTGSDTSAIMAVAMKANADVFIEINLKSQGETSGTNRHYGSANVELKLYDTSTGKVLGSVSLNSQKAFSNVSQTTAILTAVQSTIFGLMPKAIDQSKKYMAKAAYQGFKFLLTIQNTSDSKAMTSFRSKLKERARIKDLKILSATPEITRYEVYYIGDAGDLEEQIVRVADSVPGLESLQQVSIEGKNLTYSLK